MIEIRCECKDPMFPKSIHKMTGTIVFACSNPKCDKERKIVFKEVKDDYSYSYALRWCPACAIEKKEGEQGVIGNMIVLGMQQYRQGYDYNQTYEYQCLACGGIFIEHVLLQSFNALRFPRGIQVGLRAPEVEEAKRESAG